MGRRQRLPYHPQAAAGHLSPWYTEIEHGAGQMFRCMNYALDAQNFLRPRNQHIVGDAMPEMREAGPKARAGSRRHPRAASSAVEIQTEPRAEAPNSAQFRREDFIHRGMVLEDGAEPLFHSHPDTKIGPAAFQNVERRRGKDAIPQ